MASFTKKVEGKKMIGNRKINADEAIGLVFGDVKNAQLVAIKLGALLENPYQPRKVMNQEHVRELADSIEQSGLLQPIVVTPLPQNPNKFYIVAGHRRVEAIRLLNRDSIEAIIVNVDDTQLRLNALVENLQRENLSAFEEAFAVKAMVDAGLKQTEIAEKLGKSKGFVSQLMRITELDEDLIAHITQNAMEVSLSSLYELTNVPQGKQLNVFIEIFEKSMNRDEVREYIKHINEEKAPSSSKKAVNTPFIGFALKQSKDKNKISIKLDINKLKDRSEAIKTLEAIVEQLKNG